MISSRVHSGREEIMRRISSAVSCVGNSPAWLECSLALARSKDTLSGLAIISFARLLPNSKTGGLDFETYLKDLPNQEAFLFALR